MIQISWALVNPDPRSETRSFRKFKLAVISACIKVGLGFSNKVQSTLSTKSRSIVGHFCTADGAEVWHNEQVKEKIGEVDGKL